MFVVSKENRINTFGIFVLIKLLCRNCAAPESKGKNGWWPRGYSSTIILVIEVYTNISALSYHPFTFGSRNLDN